MAGPTEGPEPGPGSDPGSDPGDWPANRRRSDGGRAWWGPPSGWGQDASPWADPGPPWAQPNWAGPPRRWFLRRFAGLLIGLLIVVIVLAAIGGFVFASIFGLLGPDRPDQGGGIFFVRLAGIVVVIAGLAAVARRIRNVAGPIDELVEATRRVGRGDYTVRVSRPRRAPRELRELAAGFNTMTERLEVDEHQRRSLLADVSHELRTPLAVVRGNIEAIVDGVHPADPAHLSAILDETLVLGRLVEDLRTIALSEAGTLPLHLEPTDLRLLIEEAAGSFATMAETGAVSIDVSFDGSGAQDEADRPPLEVDPVRVREVLDNLIANALRYTPAGGIVSISTDWPAGRSTVEVSVADTGPGIAPEIAKHLFDRFVKSADSRGSGLGLAIARHIVEAHGGTIEASSRPGAGTTVRFSLPVQPERRG